MVGGRDRQARIVANELTLMCMQVIMTFAWFTLRWAFAGRRECPMPVWRKPVRFSPMASPYHNMAQLRSILEANFEGQEDVRQRFLNRIPKYGNDVDEVDDYFKVIIDHIVEECRKYNPIFQNGLLIPSVFCWVMHDRFGRVTGATPDGRPAGFPLGDGSGPCQGREMNGPTASILSSTKWSHSELIGGVAVNMKFSKKVFDDRSFANMLGLIKTYLKRGGFEMQIKPVPESYSDRACLNPFVFL